MPPTHSADSAEAPPVPLDADELRARFEAPSPLTVGIEEEVMVLDGESFNLVPRAAELLVAADGDPRFKRELPSAQLELVTRPSERIEDVVQELHTARCEAAEMAERLGLRLAAAGLHPFAAGAGPLERGEHYDGVCAEYGPIARRQLVFGLHVHVAVRGGERPVAVHDAMRSVLPELTALAANAPFYEGEDTRLATARSVISDLLPRQGPPPPLHSFEAWAAEMRWGAAAGTLPEGRRWWWEMRLHPNFGTLELRVPDAQVTAAEAGAVARVIRGLVERFSAMHDAGELPPPAAEWRIRENRWSALRHGLEGTMADLHTGRAEATRERLLRLIEELGSPPGARELIARPGYMQQREVALEGGVLTVAQGLAERFTG